LIISRVVAGKATEIFCGNMKCYYLKMRNIKEKYLEIAKLTKF
jgi:hypothetical protein